MEERKLRKKNFIRWLLLKNEEKIKCISGLRRLKPKMSNLNHRMPLHSISRTRAGRGVVEKRKRPQTFFTRHTKQTHQIPQPNSKEKWFLLGSTETKKNKYRIINPFSNPQHGLLSKGNVDGPNVSLASLLFLFLFTQKLTNLSLCFFSPWFFNGDEA